MTVALVLATACATGGAADDVPPGPDVATPGDASSDVAAPIDGSPPIDAAPPDAPLPPTQIVAISPGALTISRGGAGMLTVTLDRPAVAGGAIVTLDSDDPTGTTFTVPAAVTVPEGEIATSFAVSAVAVGGPLDVRASFQTSVQASSVTVVPALVSVSASSSEEILYGTTTTYVVSLEGPTQAPVDVALSASGVEVAIPATVTIPVGSASAPFPVTGAALGGPITLTAGVGSASVMAGARVVGLFLSEVLYDVSGADSQKEWIELYNASPLGIDVTGFRLQVANTTGPYEDSLVLTGTVPVGGCVTVGGPLVGGAASNYTPDTFVYFVAGDFSPDLGNAGSTSLDPGDGLSLATADGDIIDNVVYGRNNNDLITDESGAIPASTDVGDAPAGQSIERTTSGLSGAWAIQPLPNPGDCAAIAP